MPDRAGSRRGRRHRGGRSVRLAPALALLMAGAASAEPAPSDVRPPREAASVQETRPAAPETKPAPLPLSVKPFAGEALPTVPVPAPVELSAKKTRELPPTVYARVSEDPQPTLTPATFLDTVRMAERYKALAEAGGWSPLPAGLVLKPGERNPAVAALRGHLVMTGDLAADAVHSDLYDDTLVAAVKLFQARHGLPDSGLIARLTVNALNVPAATRQRQLAASAARLMGSNFAFGERYVAVNIPSATVEAVERGAVARRYVAVVGSPDKATPSVATRITDINLNPNWTLPVSVIRNEVIPTMRRAPGYLAKNHIRIYGPGGAEVDPTTVDWSSERATNYTLRQDPGFDNSLGQVRIDMPNKFAVYMHDTPAKSLFAGNVRFHSHGCVRVGQVKEFAAWLLQGTEGPNGSGSAWGPIEIETGIATGERRDIKLVKPVPVAFVYLTGYATADGRAHFRDDIYGLDTPAAPDATPAADVQTTGSIVPHPLVKPTPAVQGATAAAARTPIPARATRAPHPVASAAKAAPSAAKAAPSAPKSEARRPPPPRDGPPPGEAPLVPPGLVAGRG